MAEIHRKLIENEQKLDDLLAEKIGQKRKRKLSRSGSDDEDETDSPGNVQNTRIHLSDYFKIFLEVSVTE